MHKIITGALAAGLLFAVTACGSDDTSTADTTAAAATTPAAEDTTAVDATAAATDDTATAGDDTTAPADTTAVSYDQLPGLSSLQSQVVGMTLDAAAAVGIEIDEECFIAVAKQLSDADAQLIVDAGPQGSPTLSTEGEALGEQASACITTDLSTPTT